MPLSGRFSLTVTFSPVTSDLFYLLAQEKEEKKKKKKERKEKMFLPLWGLLWAI